MKNYHDLVASGRSDVAEQVQAHANRVAERLAHVRNVVAVMSGKGGVGKSTVAVNLAAAMALDDRSVGLVDADINGPSLAKMTGVGGQELRMGATGVIPPTSSTGIKVMSVDLFLTADDAPVVWKAATQKDAYTWRGTMEAAAVREFFSDTEWGALDVLIVDLPPGADKLPNLADILPELSGVVVVTLPSRVSRAVVGKSIRLTRQVLDTPVIGLVENMSSYVCPHCGEEDRLFSPPQGGTWADAYGLPLLGRIPFDPLLSEATDGGSDYMETYFDRPAARTIRRVADRVWDHLASTAGTQKTARGDGGRSDPS